MSTPKTDISLLMMLTPALKKVKQTGAAKARVKPRWEDFFINDISDGL
jgi:hypothetical protein